jgi:acyl dehydratase
MRRNCKEAVWFEDYRVGDEFAGEPVTLPEKEILDFARKYDPQSFHVDPDAAKKSPYGGLIASGFHTAAAVWGGMLRAGFLGGRGVGAPGMDVQWLKPVRPGDTLTMLARVVETRASKSKPDRGFVSIQSSITNQAGEEVMTMAFTEMIRTRPKS